MSVETITRKLTKLLRMGESSGASEGEIQNALDIASKLMAKHQLTRDDIDTSQDDPMARVVYGRRFAFCKRAIVTPWEDTLAVFVRKFIGTVGVYNRKDTPVRKNGMVVTTRNGKIKVAHAFVFFGPDLDAASAVELFEELRDSVATMAVVRWGSWDRHPGKAYADGFARGLIAAADRAILKLKTDSDAHSSALVLRSEETQLVLAERGRVWLKETHGVSLKPGKKPGMRMTSSLSYEAFGGGYEDGKNYDVTRPVHQQPASNALPK